MGECRPKAAKTLSEIERINKDMLVPSDGAAFLGTDPQSLRNQAHEAPEKLGFPVIVHGTRTIIPKAGFVDYMKYGRRKANVLG